MASIAACLIVKDAAGTLERCLASIRPHVDEVVVYDTGSTDGTLELLERLDVPVTRGEWRDDFAWARERSFELAVAEWLLWLDADDVVVGGGALWPLVDSAPPGLDGFVVFYETERDPAGNVTQHVWRVRVVRRSAGFRWEGVVHEGLFIRDGSPPDLEVVPAETLRVVHEPLPGAGDATRNLRLLLAAEAQGTLDRRTLFNLGLELTLHGRFEEAIPRLRAYAEVALDWTDERAQAVSLLAASLRALGRPQEALEVELEAARHRPDWTDAALGIAESYAAVEEWAEVERWAATARDLGVPASPVLLDPRRLTLAPLLRLAEASLARGDAEGARAALAGASLAETATLEDVRAELRRHDPALRAAVQALVTGAGGA